LLVTECEGLNTIRTSRKKIDAHGNNDNCAPSRSPHSTRGRPFTKSQLRGMPRGVEPLVGANENGAHNKKPRVFNETVLWLSHSTVSVSFSPAVQLCCRRIAKSYGCF